MKMMVSNLVFYIIVDIEIILLKNPFPSSNYVFYFCRALYTKQIHVTSLLILCENLVQNIAPSSTEPLPLTQLELRL